MRSGAWHKNDTFGGYFQSKNTPATGNFIWQRYERMTSIWYCINRHMHMYARICICTHMHACICICICICICMHIQVHANAYAYAYACAYAYAYAYAHAYAMHMHMPMHMHMNMPMHCLCICLCIRMHMHCFSKLFRWSPKHLQNRQLHMAAIRQDDISIIKSNYVDIILS